MIFNLQTAAPDYATGANLIASQNDILSYIIQVLAQAIDTSLSEQQQAIDAIVRALQASARSRVAANGRRISPVVDALATAASVAAAETNIETSRAAAAVSPISQPVDTTAISRATQPGTSDGVDASLGVAQPAVATGDVPSFPVNPPLAAPPPGCVPVALRDNPGMLLFPSGRPFEDAGINRSAALAYNLELNGYRTYYSVPSANGPTLVSPSTLVGYYDIPAGLIPYVTDPRSPPGLLCPATGPTPQPQPVPPDATIRWYCGTTADGKLQNFPLQGPLTDEIRARFVSITGPWNTLGEGVQACQGNIPEPLPPAPPAEEWYCVRSKNPAGETIYAALPFADQLAIQQTSWEYVSGPFANQATAQAVCTATQTGTTSGFSCSPISLPQMPEWCSVNVCDGIDAIIAASQGSGTIDLFKLLNAGSLEAPGGSGTWLDDIKGISFVGEALYTTIATVLCVVSGSINAVLTSAGPNIPALAIANGAGILVGILEKWLGTGFTDLHRRADYWADYISPTMIPTVGEADALLVRGFIDEKQWRCWVRANNVCDEPHKLIVEAEYLRPSWQQAERLNRIGLIDEESTDSYYLRSGINNPGERAMFRELYTQYPGMDSIIQFMVRDVFDPAVITSGQLDAEFSDKYTGVARKLGSIAGLTDDLAKLFWMAHWRQPATNELFTMLHRLRPGAVDPSLVTTQETIARQLGINDVAPAWRDKLMAISYHSISIRQARQFFQNDVIDKQGVVDIYLDQGYRPDLADKAGNNEVIVKRRALAQLFKGWTPAAIASAYAAGQMTEQEVNQRATYLGATKEQIDDLRRRAKLDRQTKVQLRAESKAISGSWTTILAAYRTGSVDRQSALAFLLSNGWSDSSAALALDSEDVRARQAVVSQAIATVRRSFLAGEVTAVAVSTQLSAIGVSPPRIAEYVATWQLQLTPRRRTLSGQQALRLYSEALIDELTVRTRLLNLGWQEPDLTLLVLEARNKLLAAEARAAAAAEREQVQAAAQLAKEVAAQQKLVQQTQAKLCGMVSVSRLIKWYAHGWINQTYLITRLRYCGYNEEAIAGYVAEADNARAKEQAKEAKASTTTGPAGSTTTGNGTVTGGASTAGP